MNTSTVTVRVDENTKNAATAVLNDIGLDVSTAVRMFLRQLVIRGQMPIELIQDSFYSPSNLAVIRESIQQLDQGTVIVKSFDELQAME